MPTSEFTHSARAAVAPDVIWQRLQRAETWLGLGVMDEVSNESIERGSLVGFDWAASVGPTSYKGSARVVGSEPGRRLLLGLKSKEIEGELEVGLEAVTGGTVIAVRLVGRPRGFLASMFWGKVSESIRRGLPRRVEEFAASL